MKRFLAVIGLVLMLTLSVAARLHMRVYDTYSLYKNTDYESYLTSLDSDAEVHTPAAEASSLYTKWINLESCTGAVQLSLYIESMTSSSIDIELYYPVAGAENDNVTIATITSAGIYTYNLQDYTVMQSPVQKIRIRVHEADAGETYYFIQLNVMEDN